MSKEPVVKEPKPKRKKPVQVDALVDGPKGVGMPKFPNVERYAIEVDDLSGEIKELKEKLEDSTAKLMAEMEKAQIETYRWRDNEVKYKKGRASIKIKHLKRPDMVPDEKN